MDLFTLVGKISIESGNSSAVMDSMIEQAGTLANTLNGTSAASGQTTDAVTRSTSRIANTVKSWSVALGNFYTQVSNKAWNAGKDFFQTGFEFNQNMEKWTASFKTYMGGDLEAASAFMEEVRQFAVETPLSLADSVQSAVRLMASGIGSGEVIDTLKMLGDIANGDTEKMSRLALVYSQVMAAGKLGGNDPIQFKEAGVPIYDLLEQYYATMGIAYDGTLDELQKAGGIRSQHVLGALIMATQEGGMYFNAMNNIMDTEYGQAQKMKDSYEQAAGSFTKAIFDVFSSDTINALNDSLNTLYAWATENPDALRNLAEGFSNLATGGIDLLVNSLTGFIEWYTANEELFNAALVMLGGIAMATGHPLAGAAMITVGGYGVWDEAQAVANTLAENPVDAAQKAESNLQNGTTIIHAMTNTGAFSDSEDGYIRNTTPWERFLLNLADLIGDETKRDVEEGMGLVGEDRSGGMRIEQEEPEEYGPPTPEWFTIDNLNPDGTSGENGIPALIAAIQAQQAEIQSIPDKIAAAFESGVSGITVTGNITTGNVRLDSGAVVGQFTPMLNLRLGWMNKLSDKG